MIKSSLFKCLHVNRFSLGCLTLNISQRSNCDIIAISLQIDFFFQLGGGGGGDHHRHLV